MCQYPLRMAMHLAIISYLISMQLGKRKHPFNKPSYPVIKIKGSACGCIAAL